jgi:hypothetical protein
MCPNILSPLTKLFGAKKQESAPVPARAAPLAFQSDAQILGGSVDGSVDGDAGKIRLGGKKKKTVRGLPGLGL